MYPELAGSSIMLRSLGGRRRHGAADITLLLLLVSASISGQRFHPVSHGIPCISGGFRWKKRPNVARPAVLMAAIIMLLLVVLCAVAPSSGGVLEEEAASPLRVWHLTDVHVDPWYVVGADASSCYCEITMPGGPPELPVCYQARAADGQCMWGDPCNCTLSHHDSTPNTANGSAGVFGNSEGNCATPKSLYESALAFMRAGRVGSGNEAGAPLVYFTGDFAEAGASVPCDGTVNYTVAQQQINDIISYDWRTLHAALPNATVLGTLGNHDAAPGDVFYGTTRQAWLYNHLGQVWADDLGHDSSALASVRKGGWYATRPVKGLTVISLNINYWETQNPQTADSSSEASKLGEDQFLWLQAALQAAETAGDKVHIIGHQPPGPNPPGPGDVWVAGAWPRFSMLVERFQHIVTGAFFGHVHTDEWTLLRGCQPPALSPTGVANWSDVKQCDGKAHTLLLPGVSLTEGFPATNPALRLLEFDPDTFALKEAFTYYADLQAANAAPEQGLQWELAYQFTQHYNMTDMSPASFELLHSDFARPGSELWDKYHGSPGGLYCTLFNASRSPFPPVYPCIGWPDGALNPDPRWPRGTVPMKDAWIAKLNATNLLA